MKDEQQPAKALRHPSTWKLFQQASKRWMALQKEHRRAAEAMWLGTIAAAFTPEEMALLGEHGYVSLRDRQLLNSIRAGRMDAEWKS